MAAMEGAREEVLAAVMAVVGEVLAVAPMEVEAPVVPAAVENLVGAGLASE